MASNGTSSGLNHKPVGQNRVASVLTTGGPEAMKEQRVGLEIVQECFIEVGDSLC